MLDEHSLQVLQGNKKYIYEVISCVTNEAKLLLKYSCCWDLQKALETLVKPQKLSESTSVF